MPLRHCFSPDACHAPLLILSSEMLSLATPLCAIHACDAAVPLPFFDAARNAMLIIIYDLFHTISNNDIIINGLPHYMLMAMPDAAMIADTYKAGMPEQPCYDDAALRYLMQYFADYTQLRCLSR